MTDAFYVEYFLLDIDSQSCYDSLAMESLDDAR